MRFSAMKFTRLPLMALPFFEAASTLRAAGHFFIIGEFCAAVYARGAITGGNFGSAANL